MVRSEKRNRGSARLRVPLGDRSYELVLASGALSTAVAELRRCGITPDSQLVVISNRRVLRFHGSTLIEPLRRKGWEVAEIAVPEGERNKSLVMVAKLYDALVRRQADRSSVIIALGGGVIGDLAGFVAATYLRGIRYIQAPTTLLAAIDSSVGGKTGVDLVTGKNLVGAFHQPRLVLTDLSTFRTLPRRQVRSGLYEAIKCAVIADRKLFEWIEHRLESVLALSSESTQHLVRRCCAIKAAVVGRDEREGGLRRILNFGHTFGHALEAATDYRRISHGEAVGLGMLMASSMAEDTGIMPAEENARLARLIRRVGPLPKCDQLSARHVYQLMLSDKKTTSAGIHFILPKRIGKVEIRAGVPRAAVMNALRRFSLR